MPRYCGYGAILELNNSHLSGFTFCKSILNTNKVCSHCRETEGYSVLLSETKRFSWMNALFYKLLRLVF